MENSDWREKLPKKLAELRKEAGLTQAELAEKINYSDKSVSKWERGDGVPDLSVLVTLSDLYNVSLDTLIGRAQKVPETKFSKLSRAAQLLTMSASVWLAATVAFVVLLLAAPSSWQCWKIFVVALPVNSVMLGVCFLRWKHYAWAFGVLSAAIWTSCLSVHLCLLQSHPLLVYAIGVLMQLSALIACGAVIIRKKL